MTTAIDRIKEAILAYDNTRMGSLREKRAAVDLICEVYRDATGLDCDPVTCYNCANGVRKYVRELELLMLHAYERSNVETTEPLTTETDGGEPTETETRISRARKKQV